MGNLPFFWLLIGGIVAYMLYNDIKTGERSFMRFLVSLVIVYVPFAAIPLIFSSDATPFSTTLVFPLACAAAAWGLLCSANDTFAEKVANWTHAVAPPVYDTMTVDNAISHLKKNGTEIEDIFRYLVVERGIPKEELGEIMERNFSDSELDGFYTGGLSR